MAISLTKSMLEFTSIRAFYEFLQMPTPLDDDFAIRRLEQAQRLTDKIGASAFRHCFYAVSLHLTGISPIKLAA
jgi:hypothetical protein